MRCFIALPLPDAAVLALDLTASRLKEAWPVLSWVKKDNYHLTLAFLGEQGPEGLAAARSALAAVRASGRIAIMPRGLSTFPPRGPWRVLVAEFGDACPGANSGEARPAGAGSLVSLNRLLNERLEEEARAAGLPPLNADWQPEGQGRTGRPFRAHITLARRPSHGRGHASLDPRILAQAEAELASHLPEGGPCAGGWPLEALVLYKSELRRGGAVYEELDRANLAPF